MSLSKKHILVTGGSGFIGSALVSALKRNGAHVTVYDNVHPKTKVDGCIYLINDIRNASALEDAIFGKEKIIHLAGIIGTEYLFNNPIDAVDINVIGTLNVIEIVKRTMPKTPIVVLGKTNEWNNIYSLTSQAIEKAALSYNEHFEMDIRVLRTWNPFGPGQIDTPVQKLIPRAIVNALNNEDILLYGGGAEILQLSYILNVVDCIIKFVAASNMPQPIFEYDMGHRISVKDVVSKIIEYTQSKSKTISVPTRIGETPNTSFKPTQSISSIISIEKLNNFDCDLIKTIAWQRSYARRDLNNAA